MQDSEDQEFGGPRPEDSGGDDPRISADVAGSFTYASYQNAIPVVRSIRIENASGRHLEKCRVELTSSPAFLRPKSWIIDRLIPGDSLPLNDRKVDLDANYLAGLNEAERGEITLRLSANGAVLDEKRFPVRLLARDEWGGVADMAQLLPAFVMPNDPAVARVLRIAADRLAEHGHPSGMDGYLLALAIIRARARNHRRFLLELPANGAALVLTLATSVLAIIAACSPTEVPAHTGRQ